MKRRRGGEFVSALDWFVPCWFTFRRQIPFAALSQLGTPIASFFNNSRCWQFSSLYLSGGGVSD
jgi:hypothetical protein